MRDLGRVERIAVLQRLRGAAVARGTAPLPLGRWPFAAWLFVSLVGVVAVATRGFGDSCEPVHPWPWPLAYVVFSLPFALAIAHAARERLGSLGIALTPGIHRLENEIVVLKRGVLTMMPLASIAGVSLSPHWLGRVRITFWCVGAGPVSLVVKASDGREVVDWLEHADVRVENLGYRDTADRGPALDVPSSQGDRAIWSRTATRLAARACFVGTVIGAAVLLGLAFGRVRDELGVRAALARAMTGDAPQIACVFQNDEIFARYVGGQALEYVGPAQALEAGDWEAILHDHPDSAYAHVARVQVRETAYAAAWGDPWRLRAFLARFPDDPRRPVIEARLAALGRDEAITRDDVQVYGYVARESPAVASEMRDHRTDRFARVRDALRERHGDVEAVAFFDDLLRFVETNDVEVLLRIETRIEQGRHARHPLGQISSELREPLLARRMLAAFAESVPADVLPIVMGPPLPHRTDATQREALLQPVELDERPDALARLATKEDDDSGQPEIRVTYSVTETSSTERAYLTGHFEVEARIPNGRSLSRSLEASIERGESHEAALIAMFERLERDLEGVLFAASSRSST